MLFVLRQCGISIILLDFSHIWPAVSPCCCSEFAVYNFI